MKREIGFGIYPLCIDTIDKDVDDIERFDVSTSSIVCDESAEQDTLAPSLVKLKKWWIGLHRIVRGDKYIYDAKSTNVKVDQLYKDKAILIYDSFILRSTLFRYLSPWKLFRLIELDL